MLLKKLLGLVPVRREHGGPKIMISVSSSSTDAIDGMSSDQIRAQELASQAVRLKDIQLPKAVELLKEATILWPANSEIAFRLARYLRETGARDEAFAIYRRRLASVDRNDYLFWGFNCESIFEEMCKQLYEEQRFNYYLYYHVQRLWTTLVGLAAQGRFDGFNEDIFLSYGPQTKMTKALKKLSLHEFQDEIARGVFSRLMETRVDLQRLSEISKANEFRDSDQAPQGLSSGEQRLHVLAKNEEYLRLFNRMASPRVPDSIYKEEIAVRLKGSERLVITDGAA